MTLTAEAKTFGADEVLAALEAVVKGNEGHIDPNSQDMTVACRYVDKKGNPMCIVGRALSYLHVDILHLEAMDHLGNPMFEADPIGYLNGQGIHFDQEAIAILSAAQYEQDAGKNWGAALSRARREHESLTA